MLDADWLESSAEFARLVARQNDVDVVRVALEIARDAYPTFDESTTLGWIKRRSAELAGPLARSCNDRQLLRELSKCLAGMHGLHGDREAYHRAECSYLHRVVETGVGIPISLSLVYVAVARQAGVDLHGIAAPAHFLTRYESSDGPLFLDAFHGGAIRDYDRTMSWLRSVSGLSGREIARTLEPASDRDIVIRMLNNLKAVYVRETDWANAWFVQRRLTALHPAGYDEQRDLALVSLKSGRPGIAIDLFEQCLRRCPSSDRSLLRAQQLEAERMISGWN